ncbi:hypothetical protein D3C84_781940 [compost metagenome]
MLPGARIIGGQFIVRRQCKQQRCEQLPGFRIGWQKPVGFPVFIDQFLAGLGNAQQVHHRPANALVFTLDHQYPILALVSLQALDMQLHGQRKVRVLLGQRRTTGAGAQQQGRRDQQPSQTARHPRGSELVREGGEAFNINLS